MASVHHLCADAHYLPYHIIKTHSLLQAYEKETHYAALRIQRLWRGYTVRKIIEGWNIAATKIQQHVRGRLLRLHLPEIYQKYWEYRVQKRYNVEAAKIQACWRGHLGRKHAAEIRRAKKEREDVEKANAAMREHFEQFKRDEEKNRTMQPSNEDSMKLVVFILFKLHHLIRTECIEGIYSLRGTHRLSPIEEMLKAMPFTEYMKNVRQEYCKLSEAHHPKQYIFKSKKLQNLEDLCRMSKKYDYKPTPKYIRDNRFKLSTKTKEKPYERMLMGGEKYQTCKTVLRKPDTSKCTQKENTNVPIKKPPPYYIDIWQKSCKIHNLSDF